MVTERRNSPRFECSGPAGVQTAPSEPFLPATIVNLSAGGCLLKLGEPHNLTQDMIVELTFRIHDLPLRVWGKVRAVRSKTAVGFEFPLLSPRVRKRLEELITQLIEDFLTQCPLGPEAEQRRHTRVACSGSAEVQLNAGEPAFPAKVVNVSEGGCLMVFDQPQRLAEDQVVELSFQVNRVPFRLRGQVKAIRSQTRIGFEFPELSTEMRRQLEDLVEKLIENLVERFAENRELA